MGLILWIDQNTFATGLIEKVFKKKSLPFYSLNSVVDFAYLVKDLGPALIVLDGETFQQHPQVFIDQYLESAEMQKLPFLLIDPSNDFSFIKNIAGEIKRPFDPFDMPAMISKLLGSH